MKPHSLFALSLLLAVVGALRLPLKRDVVRRSGVTNVVVAKPQFDNTNIKALGDGKNDEPLTSKYDLIYMLPMNIGGDDFIVQIDTGSSDLWVQGPVSNSEPSSITRNLTYGIGWASGTVSYASVICAGITVPNQAFLNVNQANNPALAYGAQGVLGLGFTSLSTIDYLVNGTGSSNGRSLLFNLFEKNPSEPNFISFAIQRGSDPTDEVNGTFTIGEYDPNYAGIADSPQIPTFPVQSPRRWTVLVDSYIVNGQSFGLTSGVKNAPSIHAVALLDSGTSYTYCTKDVADAIYAGIPGATFDTGYGQWFVPCNVEVDMAVVIAGVPYPVHPLDVVMKNPVDPTKCLGTFVPQPVSVGAGDFDWLIGDNFLRSVYSLYDFGDFDSSGAMGNPYVQLLSIIDPNKASADFASARGSAPRTNITYNASGSPVTPAAAAASSASSSDISGSLEDSLKKIVIYIPAMLGVLFLNAVALVVVAIVGIVTLVRRKRTKKNRKSKELTDISLSRALAPSRGTYEAVDAGAIEPEDPPFTPPEPAFHHTEGGNQPRNHLRSAPGVRPYSTASSTGSLRPNPAMYRVSAADSEHTLFMPPAPAFKGEDKMDRPKSVA